MIREICAADMAACAGILCAVYNNDLWQCRWTTETAAAYLADIMRMPGFFGYVDEEDGIICGAVFAREKIWWNASEAYVEEIFVHPDMQRSGCGTRLMGQIECDVRERGLAGITLSTNRYAPASAFYRKLGFADCGHVLFMAKTCDE
ncbi:MAG: GNAT family N-acetyltransferase [Clostridia bacterium]|nr:GNAT family N-acetyltransferase [Clostridia bacterium]